MKRSALAWTSALALAVALVPGLAAGQTTQVFEVNDSIVIPAGTPWNSPVAFDEVCDFDLAVDYDEVFEITQFDTYEVYHITINDLYKNKATGYRFFDTAEYYIRHDLGTQEAFHAGVFWSVLAGRGHRTKEVLRDWGTFWQDWSGDYPWPVHDLVGEHPGNGVPFGTLSYCDWAQGIFPDQPAGDDEDGEGAPHQPREKKEKKEKGRRSR